MSTIKDYTMDEFLKLSMDEFLSLREIVFKTLRQAILRGDLAPGERLMEISLANRMGVSRTPIREAIRKLELEGLVLMIPRKGAEVARISEKHLRDVLEVRRTLEELAVELACERMTEETIGQLVKAKEDFEQSISKEDITTIAQKDEYFHDIIYEATNNAKLVQMINNLREQIYRFRLECIKEEQMRMELCKEHNEIVKALKERDIKTAKKAVCEHIEQQGITVSRKIQQENAITENTK